MNNGFWHGHPATRKQRQLALNRTRPTQADLIIQLLREKRARGKPLEHPDIMAAGIAQNGARMKEIRQRGFIVRNELERSPDGRVLSRYWLDRDPEQGVQP
jgi:hypothetical protein